jgi:hypothetical protein
MIPPLECRLRASECEHMAQQAPRAQVRDILLDMAQTWRRLALEGEQWTQAKLLTRDAPRRTPGELINLGRLICASPGRQMCNQIPSPHGT